MRSHYLWRLRAYYRQVAGLLFVGFISGVVKNVTVVLPPMLFGRAIDAALALDAGLAPFRLLLTAALLYVGGSALNMLGQMGKRWWLQTANHRVVANMRSDALAGVLSWPMERLHTASIGDIMARVIGDTQVFRVGFNESTTELLDTWLFSISLVVAMMSYDVSLSLMAIAPVPLAFVLAYVSGKWIRARTFATRTANSSLTTVLQEYLTGVRIFKLFGCRDEAVSRVDCLSGELRDANLSETRLRLGLQPIYSALVTSGLLLVVWLGGQRVVGGLLTTGALVAFVQLYTRFVTRGHRIPEFFNRIQAAGVAYSRLEPLLSPVPDRRNDPRFASFQPRLINGIDHPARVAPDGGAGPLPAELDGVTFHYPGSEIVALDGVSLRVRPGSLTAITGPVGSGKSALLRLLVGLYPPQNGSVTVDGRAVTEWPADHRALRVTYLPQDPGLFAGTVRDNVGTDAENREREREILSRSGLERDVREFPDGMETFIGEEGIQVSGGQRQRIGLARALAAGRSNHPGLLLLDDPFASIDVETEVEIIEELRTAYGPTAAPDHQATIVLCSHRLAAFPHADQVIVLDKGRIRERGTHDELLAAGGLYAHIHWAQRQIERSDGSSLDGDRR